MKENEIREFFQRDFLENQAIEYLISKEKENNKVYDYFIRKLLSQLEIRDHIYNMGPSLCCPNTSLIFKQIADNKECHYIKEIIEKDKNDFNEITILDEYNRILNPSVQIEQKAMHQKKNIFFNHKKKIDIMVDYYYRIPRRIEIIREKMKNNDINYYNQILELLKLKKSAKELILEYFSEKEDIREELQTYWELFYLMHEKELRKWIRLHLKDINNLNTEEEKENRIKQIIGDYFLSVSNFSKYVYNLKRDILGNLSMYKYVFCTNHRQQKFIYLINDIRIHMYKEMIQIGSKITEYRNYNFPFVEDVFFQYTAKTEEIEEKMNQLEIRYEEIKKIEDRDQYINGIIQLFEDFIKVHPYENGNGRSSRFLLDIMLINRDILPPILYDTYYDRFDLDTPSNEYTMGNNIDPIISFIKGRIEDTNNKYS